MIGVNQYKDLFINESKEILGRLNNCLVTLEKHPEDLECLNEMLREAHTLKSMAGAMGYEDITGLTHEAESILDLLRRGDIKLGKQTMDLLFEAFDAMEELLRRESLPERDGSPAPLEIHTIAAKLKRISSRYVRDGRAVMRKGRARARLEKGEQAEVLKDVKEGLAAYKVAISMARECPLKEAKAFMALKELQGMGRIVGAKGVAAQLEGGTFGRHFGLVLMTAHPADSVRKRVKTIQGIERVELKPLGAGELIERAAPPPKRITRTAEAPKGKPELQTVRVAMDKLDHLMNIVGELIIGRVRLADIGKSLELKPLTEAIMHMERLTDELQGEMMQMRLIPLEYIFNRFPRMVRDLAGEKQKKVDLIVEGSDIGLDRTALEGIGKPLVHLLRNAVDHGIETPEERKAAGKVEAGTIRLGARRERNVVIIQVSDDGRGMDAGAIRKAAVRGGIISSEEAAGLSDEETLMLITSPGFSTRATASRASGRGMGMSAVRTIVESLGGTLRIESAVNAGSRFILQLPLTMAIIKALLVRVHGETYAIPMANVLQTAKIEKASIRQIKQHETISYRDAALPLVRLAAALGFEDASDETAVAGRLPVVVVEAGARKAGLAVDGIIGQQEVMIKTLGGALKNVSGIAGTTILVDGKVAMIVDLASVISS